MIDAVVFDVGEALVNGPRVSQRFSTVPPWMVKSRMPSGLRTSWQRVWQSFRADVAWRGRLIAENVVALDRLPAGTHEHSQPMQNDLPGKHSLP